MKVTELKVGICKTCKNHWYARFDPSPAGVALSAGSMVDEGCFVDDKLEQYDNPEMGKDIDNQCPLWVMPELTYCTKHKIWYWGECEECANGYYNQEM